MLGYGHKSFARQQTNLRILDSDGSFCSNRNILELLNDLNLKSLLFLSIIFIVDFRISSEFNDINTEKP